MSDGSSKPDLPRVLLVADKLGYDDRRLHGEGRLMVEWTRGLLRAGAPVTAVVLRRPGAIAAELRAEGLPFVYLSRGFFDPRTLTDLIRIIRERHLQVMHVQGYGSITLGRIAARWCRVPVIVHIHTDYLAWGHGFKWWLRILNGLLRPWTTRCLAVSEAAARSAVKVQGFAPDIVRVLLNPVDVRRFHPAEPPAREDQRRALGIDDAEPVVVCVARLFPFKGIERLLGAWAIVRERTHRGHLRIVGDGPERAALERCAAQLALGPSARFTGHRSDVEQILQACELMALPSRSDPGPLTILEGMATRLPIVAFRVGGIPEAVRDGEDGLLVTPDDVDGFASALERLMSDELLRRRMGASALARAHELSMDRFMERLLAEYRSLVGSGTAP